MEAKIQDVYICQQERTDELNNRIMNRNYSTHQMTPKYFSRPVSNRRVIFPKVDNYKEMTVNKAIFKNYDMSNDFHPGTGGPYNAYSDNIDKESSLFNRFQPLQRCPQTTFIPNSFSDLYVQMGPKPINQKEQFGLLQENVNFEDFNPDSCELSKETFFNHTRQQLKDVKI
tara:strand:- start:3836 stop:4348 length:513 start_codon:yes stop_codon:yes gene_type:complete